MEKQHEWNKQQKIANYKIYFARYMRGENEIKLFTNKRLSSTIGGNKNLCQL